MSGCIEGIVGDEHGAKESEEDEHHGLVGDWVDEAVDDLGKGLCVELGPAGRRRVLLHTRLPSHTGHLHGRNPERGTTSVLHVLL